MEPPTLEHDADTNAISREDGDDASPQSEESILSLLKSLMALVNDKLTTDVYGNFYIRGSHGARDGRHGQLREVVEMNHLMGALLAREERKAAATVEDAAVQGGKRSKLETIPLP